MSFLWIVAITVTALADDEIGDEDDDAEIENRVIIVDGRTQIHIDKTQYQRIGLETKQAQAHAYVAETALISVVVDTAALLQSHHALQRTQTDLNSDRKVTAKQRQLVEHYRQMRNQGMATNVTEMGREERVLAETSARVAAGELRQEQLRSQALNRWGEVVGSRIGHSGDVLIDDLITHKRTMLAVRVPAATKLSAPYPKIVVDHRGHRDEASEALWLGPAPNVPSGYGAIFYVVTKHKNLSVGRRINVWLSDGQGATSGIAMPSAAVIWHAGAQWVYVELEPGKFERRRIEVTAMRGGDVFVSNTLTPQDIIVSRGASSLLGEEYRWSIPDEDDD